MLTIYQVIKQNHQSAYLIILAVQEFFIGVLWRVAWHVRWRTLTSSFHSSIVPA
jgi:hypothetical protein